MICRRDWLLQLSSSVYRPLYNAFRDGPLENLWGGAGEVQKKNSRQGKLNEKKFLQAN